MSINFTALMLADDSMLHDNSKLIVSIIKDYPTSNDETLFITLMLVNPNGAGLLDVA